MPSLKFEFATTAAAVRATLGRSISIKNSKMPGSSFATDPFACAVGAKLAVVPGSTCSQCYARRIAKMRPSVALGYERNEQALVDASLLTGEAREAFILGMRDQILRAVEKTGEPYHRWFDAGDLASLAVLILINDIALATPTVKHWLPTRELAVARRFNNRWMNYSLKGDRLETLTLADNLVIRASAAMVDGNPPSRFENTSTVHKLNAPIGHACPAQSQGNQCGACRACWDKNVANVSYHKH